MQRNLYDHLQSSNTISVDDTGDVMLEVDKGETLFDQWFEQWDPQQLSIKPKQHSAISVEHKLLPELTPQDKEKTRRERNRKSAKSSRERRKQSLEEDIKNNKCLIEKNKELNENIEKRRNSLHKLNFIHRSIIHQESCMEHDAVDINQQTVKEIQDNTAQIAYNITCSSSNQYNSQQMMEMNHQQQEQQPIEQEGGVQGARSHVVLMGTNIVRSGESFSPNNGFSSNSFLSTTERSDHLNFPDLYYSNIDVSTIKETNAEPVIHNVDTFCQANMSNSQNNNLCSLSSAASATYNFSFPSPWNVETNQEVEKDHKLLKNYFNILE